MQVWDHPDLMPDVHRFRNIPDQLPAMYGLGVMSWSGRDRVKLTDNFKTKYQPIATAAFYMSIALLRPSVSNQHTLY